MSRRYDRRFQPLRARARLMARRLGHVLRENWRHHGERSRSSWCEACGWGVRVNLVRLARQRSVEGPAVTSRCPGQMPDPSEG